jgi:hypothetical protein
MDRTVAFLDILGFRSLVETEPIDKLGPRFEKLMPILPAFGRKLGDYTHEPSFFPQVAAKEDWCIVHMFSDSIILISGDDSETKCLALMVAALRMTQVLITSGLPVRGGIARGELYTDNRNTLFVGRALTRAFDLEKQQNWIGVGIDPSVI